MSICIPYHQLLLPGSLFSDKNLKFWVGRQTLTLNQLKMDLRLVEIHCGMILMESLFNLHPLACGPTHFYVRIPSSDFPFSLIYRFAIMGNTIVALLIIINMTDGSCMMIQMWKWVTFPSNNVNSPVPFYSSLDETFRSEDWNFHSHL